jgi:hypothetical protein
MREYRDSIAQVGASVDPETLIRSAHAALRGDWQEAAMHVKLLRPIAAGAVETSAEGPHSRISGESPGRPKAHLGGHLSGPFNSSGRLVRKQGDSNRVRQ